MTTTVRLTWWVNGHRIERDLLKARACPKCDTTARVQLFDPHCDDQVELAWRAAQPFMPVACGLCDEPYALDQRPRSIRDAETREQLAAHWDAVDAQLAAAEKQLKAGRLVDDVAGAALPAMRLYQGTEQRPAPLRVPVGPLERRDALERHNKEAKAHLLREWQASSGAPSFFGVDRERALQRALLRGALPRRGVLERIRDALSGAWAGWRGEL